MKIKSKVLKQKNENPSTIMTGYKDSYNNEQPDFKTVGLNKKPKDKEPKQPRSSPLQANDFQEFQSGAAYSRLVDNLQQNIENVPAKSLKKKTKSVR